MIIQRFIEIVEYSSKDVIEKYDVTGKSDLQISKIEQGININLNHERYFTRYITVIPDELKDKY